MHSAEELKNEGNRLFSNGDLGGAIAAYKQAIDSVREAVASSEGTGIASGPISDSDKLLAVLFSNLSNAYLSRRDYTMSWKAAEEATRCDPTFSKAWLRYIHSRRLDGYPFEAFVALLRYLRPLLRKEAELSTESTIEGVEAVVSAPLYAALGLSNVLPHIELQSYANGVGMVALQPIKPSEVILVEKRFESSVVEVDLNTSQDTTTSTIVSHFASKAFAHQQRQSKEWRRFMKELKGCWPRTPKDVPDEMRQEITAALRPQLPPMEDDEFEELFLVSMVCRYNCFHTGLFRACALANHSCTANAAMRLNSAAGHVTLIAVRPIAAGEFINVKYISDAQFLMGVGKRREYLRSWLFWCECDRCVCDSKGLSTSEHVQCGSCRQYTCVPLRGGGAELKEADPLLHEYVPCSLCGFRCSWSLESRTAVEQVLDSLKVTMSCSSCDELEGWLMLNVRRVKELGVHPEHWLYRVLLYFFCFSVIPYVNEAFLSYQRIGWRAPKVNILLTNFGFCSEYPPPAAGCVEVVECDVCNGLEADTCSSCDSSYQLDAKSMGDTLYIFCLLWRLIEPFYPPHEGWALHRAICYIALFSHTHPNEELALPETLTRRLLGKHGKYIEDKEKSVWVDAYSCHKPEETRRGALNLKQIKNIMRMA